jgi:hypothetical protein
VSVLLDLWNTESSYYTMVPVFLVIVAFIAVVVGALVEQLELNKKLKRPLSADELKQRIIAGLQDISTEFVFGIPDGLWGSRVSLTRHGYSAPSFMIKVDADLPQEGQILLTAASSAGAIERYAGTQAGVDELIARIKQETEVLVA